MSFKRIVKEYDTNESICLLLCEYHLMHLRIDIREYSNDS